MQLHHGASSRCLAKALGNAISEATIRRWARFRAGVIEGRYYIKAGEVSSSPAAPSEESIQAEEAVEMTAPKGIGETAEGKKLAGMILRHQGKSRWKYSSAERKLIIYLSETHLWL